MSLAVPRREERHPRPAPPVQGGQRLPRRGPDHLVVGVRHRRDVAAEDVPHGALEHSELRRLRVGVLLFHPLVRHEDGLAHLRAEPHSTSERPESSLIYA